MTESRIAWRRVSRGLVFIGFGVFFFLSTQGMLHRGFWLDALSFWPVFLIATSARSWRESCQRGPGGKGLRPRPHDWRSRPHRPGVDVPAGSILLDVPLAALVTLRKPVASDPRGHRCVDADALP